MKKIISLSILIVLFVSLQAQIDCSKQSATFYITDGYIKSDISTSEVVKSGEIYNFMIPLKAGKEYRLYFMASSVFNNRINIKIIERSSNQIVIDTYYKKTQDDWGDDYDQKLLKTEWNEEDNKMEQPHIDLEPVTSTNIVIIIDVLEAEKEITSDKIKKLRGCFSIIVLEKKL